MKLFDVTRPIHPGMAVYPGDPEVVVRRVSSISDRSARQRLLAEPGLPHGDPCGPSAPLSRRGARRRPASPGCPDRSGPSVRGRDPEADRRGQPGGSGSRRVSPGAFQGSVFEPQSTGTWSSGGRGHRRGRRRDPDPGGRAVGGSGRTLGRPGRIGRFSSPSSAPRGRRHHRGRLGSLRRATRPVRTALSAVEAPRGGRRAGARNPPGRRLTDLTGAAAEGPPRFPVTCPRAAAILPRPRMAWGGGDTGRHG